ncbi:MAG TPA: DUF2437 domain-containing protein, partial [Streptosporangiaceae bacterium]|nr:DUF2437 domain-containing protein [Streptosporangiaceae bacterium]
MRIARFAVGDEVAYGVVVADGANGTSHAQPSESGDPSAGLSVAEISGHPFGPSAEGPKLTGARYPIEDI